MMVFIWGTAQGSHLSMRARAKEREREILVEEWEQCGRRLCG